MSAPDARTRVKTTWCQLPSFSPVPDWIVVSAFPVPARMRPFELSETPKSFVVPAVFASTSPAPDCQVVPVPMPCVELNQNSIEKLSETWRAVRM